MDKKNGKQKRIEVMSNSSRRSGKVYQRESPKMRRQRQEGFFDKSFDYRNYIYSPEGYEGIMLAFYLMTLPYLLGLVCLFLFVADASYEYFLQFELASFFIIWAIGYEVSAGLMLAGLSLGWLKFRSNRSKWEEANKKSNRH